MLSAHRKLSAPLARSSQRVCCSTTRTCHRLPEGRTTIKNRAMPHTLNGAFLSLGLLDGSFGNAAVHGWSYGLGLTLTSYVPASSNLISDQVGVNQPLLFSSLNRGISHHALPVCEDVAFMGRICDDRAGFWPGVSRLPVWASETRLSKPKILLFCSWSNIDVDPLNRTQRRSTSLWLLYCLCLSGDWQSRLSQTVCCPHPTVLMEPRHQSSSQGNVNMNQ